MPRRSRVVEEGASRAGDDRAATKKKNFVFFH